VKRDTLIWHTYSGNPLQETAVNYAVQWLLHMNMSPQGVAILFSVNI